MSDPGSPRVHVTLPGGHATTGRLQRWRQGPDGRWWAEIATYVPAAAIQQIDGEDYIGVAREPAQPAGPRYVLAVDTRRELPTLELHTADCWGIEEPAQWVRITPVPDAKDARDMLRGADTTACTACQPQP